MTVRTPHPSVFDLVDTLRERYAELSAGQRRIADVLVQHPDEAQFLTAAQLADRAGISESAVVRFAQFLGLSGYPELRRAVRQDFRARATNSAMVVSGRTALVNQPNLIREIAERDASLIHETAVQLDPAILERWVEQILAAGQVLVTGHRTSYALAEYLAITLRQSIGVGTPLAFGTGMVFDIIGSAKPGDVIVGISITPYATQTVDALSAAKEQGLTVLVITDHPLGAPARLADEVLLFETEILAFTSSYVGVMTLIHMLLAAISIRSADRSETFLARVDAMHEAFGTRFAPGAAGTANGRDRSAPGVPGNGRTDGISRRSGDNGQTVE